MPDPLPAPATDCAQRAICHIAVSPTHEIVADVGICHIDPPTRGRVSRIGARFVDLRADQTRRLEHFCAELARKQRRVG
ncbi:MAG: hypothetical protein EXR86_16140 [Gammaproteobacteria bacterium]|nr:hypothetical protein [Gammaproteobacteria bacterium]